MAYEIFKNTKNRISRHNVLELLYEFLKLLNDPKATDIQKMRYYPPWYLLLLVKWVVLYGTYQQIETNKPVNTKVVNALVNRMHSLADVVRKPNQYQNWLLFLRNMAFQQFWLQEPYTIQKITRQYILFGKLPANHSLQTRFSDLVKIPIADFLELSLALIAYFQKTQRISFISSEWFSSMKSSYPSDTIEKFLTAISIDIEEARIWLQGNEAGKNEKERLVDYEFYEQSPFTRYPLLKRGDVYFCIFPALLNHSLQTFVYDILRNDNAEVFMEKFGAMFEAIVRNSVTTLSTPFLSENDLNEYFSKTQNQKVVDFLLVDGGNNIFIDAKGVAMSWIGMVTHQPGTIRNQAKSSILKGIEQAYGLAERLSSEKVIKHVTLGQKENYLLIITFKDLYVSNGKNFRDLIAPDEVDKIIAKYGGKEWISLSNIYFISIDDLDILVSCVQNSRRSLNELIQYAIQCDSEPQKTKFVFRQHIFEICEEANPPEYLNTALEEFKANLRRKIID